jgi:preprotein translocase subunit SecD
MERSHFMRRSACLLAALLIPGSYALTFAGHKTPPSPRTVPDGVYAVLRDSPQKSDVLPLKDGEALVVNRHRYLKEADKQPARFLVVHGTPDVALDLAGKPKAEYDGKDVVRILLKLQTKAATSLEHLTSERLGKQVAIVVGGEAVTVHTIRTVIRGGDVQITSCEPGAAKHLLERLVARQEKK